MKHILLPILLVLCSIAASAQVPMFYGVPVDGTPDAFVNALRDKGLELEIQSEDYGERVYRVNNYFMPTNISVKYHNSVINKVMMIALPGNGSSVVNTVEYFIKIMKEDNGEDGYTESDSEKVLVLCKTLNSGQVGVFVVLPGYESPDYAVSYIVENFDNSRKVAK